MSDLISREDTIDDLHTANIPDEWMAWTENFINAQPSVEPCADCVSRESVKKLLNEGWLRGIYPSSGNIDALPSVTPERPRGKWIEHQDRKKQIYAECSNCGFKNYAGILNYCPECGADMKGEHT